MRKKKAEKKDAAATDRYIKLCDHFIETWRKYESAFYSIGGRGSRARGGAYGRGASDGGIVLSAYLNRTPD